MTKHLGQRIYEKIRNEQRRERCARRCKFHEENRAKAKARRQAQSNQTNNAAAKYAKEQG